MLAGDGPGQFFPPALRFRLRADGQLGDEPVEPGAATALRLGELADAQSLAERALSTRTEAPGGWDLVLEASGTAELQLIAGDVRRATAGPEAAVPHWRAGLEALEKLPADTLSPLVMQLHAELLSRLARCEDAERLRAKMASLGAWAPENDCPPSAGVSPIEMIGNSPPQ